MRLNLTRKKVFTAVATMVVAVGAFVTLQVLTGGSLAAVSFGEGRRDCDYTDVIVNCGTRSTQELLEVYDSNNDRRGNRDIQAIFNHYGITRSDITGSEVKKGWLNTNGTIVVDGETVATNAKSLYRVHPGKEVSPVNIAGKTYYIGPVNNNYRLGADVFVFYRNGQFHAAIQASCGNPIIATPTPKPKPQPKPEYSCDSLKATKIDRTRYSFTASASAKNGATVNSFNYDFGDGTKLTAVGNTVQHTYAKPGKYNVAATVNVNVNGQIAVNHSQNCKVTITVEEEPKQPEYKCESLTSKKLSRNRHSFTATGSATNGADITGYTYNFGDGTSTVTTTNRTVEHTYAKPGTYTAKVTVNVRANGQNKTTTGPKCEVKVTIEEEPKQPVYRCDSLAAQKLSRDRYRFTVTSTAENGANVVSYTYNFGDGTSTVTTPNRTVEHTYAKPGNYTAKVTVNLNVNGQNKTTTGPKCEVKVTIEEEPKQPSYKCENLKVIKKVSRTEFQFQATASVENATIKSYTFNFGDGKSESVTSTAKTATVSHAYDKPGSYTASVSVSMSDGKTVTGPECKVTVKVDEKPDEKNPGIEIEKTVNSKEHAKVPVGDEFTYEITVRNTGNVVLKNAIVVDKAPSQVTLVSSELGTIKNNEWTYTIPQLNIGESKQFTIKAKYTKYAEGTHKNTVCVDTPTVPGNPDDCDDATTETKEPIEVCDLNDNTVKTIEKSEFDETHMTTDLSKCGNIEVCIIEDKVIKSIAKNEYDESTMTTDLSKCEESPIVPPELPKTGLQTIIGGTIGIGSITAAGYYWAASRRNLLSTLLNR